VNSVDLLGGGDFHYDLILRYKSVFILI